MNTSQVVAGLIPDTHVDLVDGLYCVALTTPVWCNREGDCVLINTMRGFRKERNMRKDPRVTLLIYDPEKPLRNLEIRGIVEEMTEEGALEHLDALTQKYMQKPDAHFFGDSIPAHLQATHIPVKVRIRPLHVRVEG